MTFDCFRFTKVNSRTLGMNERMKKWTNERTNEWSNEWSDVLLDPLCFIVVDQEYSLLSDFGIYRCRHHMHFSHQLCLQCIWVQIFTRHRRQCREQYHINLTWCVRALIFLVIVLCIVAILFSMINQSQEQFYAIDRLTTKYLLNLTQKQQNSNNGCFSPRGASNQVVLPVWVSFLPFSLYSDCGVLQLKPVFVELTLST